MRIVMFLTCHVFLSTPVLAEVPLQRPDSCVRVATAQYSDCDVYNHFKCTGTSPVVYRVESVDESGVLTIETYDANHGAIGLSDSSGEMASSITTQTEHPRLALETGLRNERFEGTINGFGATLTLQGQSTYRYTGERLKLTGETFHRMPFDAEVLSEGTAFGEDMGFSMTVEGSMLFTDKLDLWLEEASRSKFDQDAEEVSNLRLLSLPGQDGFGDEAPMFGCSGISHLKLWTPEVPA